MATRPKAVIESRNGEKFSPITIAKNVLTDNGQNLHDILSDRKEDTMTPTIENSSSMFKVGQGDNVDYSGNVVNGAYDSMVLKGKTMVNCIQEPSSQDVVLPYEFADGQYVTINDTKESGALGIELKGQTLVNLLGELAVDLNNNPWSEDENNYILDLATGNGQPTLSFRTLYTLPANKTYTLFINMTSYVTGVIHIDFRTPSNTSSSSNQLYFGKAGWQKLVFTTTEETAFVRMFNRNGVDNTYSIGKSLMLLEGDHTNTPIPNYFTGIASCKMPTLHTVGKNLFDGKLEKGSLDVNTGKPSVDNSFNRTVNFIRIYPNKEYRLRANGTTNGRVFYYDENKVYISTQLNENRLTNIPSNAKYLKFRIGADILSNGQEIQLEEGSVATAYEPYKSSILSLPEEVVLRGIGDIKDTLNLTTGELAQAVYEYTFTGDEAWGIAGGNSGGYSYFNCYANQLPVNFDYGNGANVPLTCNTLPKVDYSDFDNRLKNVGINLTYSVRLNFRDCDSNNGATVEDLKAYLKANPTTIQYPIKKSIKTVDLNVVDQNGSVISTLKSWNTTTHIYSEIPENTLYPILSHLNPTYPVILKPNTKYSIVANSYSNDHTNSAINFNLGGATASTIVGNRVTTITTPSTLSNELLTMSGRGNKLNNVMVIEGDVVGDEPYFEGICDCKSPILSNVGKNLWNIPSKAFDGKNYTVPSGNGYYGCKIMTLPRGTYFVKATLKNNDIVDDYMYFGITNFSINNNGNHSFNVFYATGKGYNTNITNGFKIKITSDFQDIYLWSTSRASSSIQRVLNCLDEVHMELTNEEDIVYESYKSNTTTFNQKDDKTIVLRSLPDGTCDTLNVETGECIQRIAQFTLTGNESNAWNVSNDSSGEAAYITVANIIPEVKGTEGLIGNLISDTFHNDNPYHVTRHERCIGAYQTHIRIKIPEIELSANSYKDYFRNNPTTIQYELATPIVSTIDVQGFPYAYKNGHVQLSSGSIEQSLTPKVEYSVVTNRNGQIRSNQKMVERQQKQLDRLQAMILTNLVNTQYEQTLTNLKYDLKNVREEVK